MVCCVCRNCQAGWPAWPGTKGVVFHACHTATSKRTTDEQINSRHSSALPSAHLCTGTQTREQFIASLSNILKRIFKETEREGVDWINLVQDRGKKRAAVNTEWAFRFQKVWTVSSPSTNTGCSRRTRSRGVSVELWNSTVAALTQKVPPVKSGKLDQAPDHKAQLLATSRNATWTGYWRTCCTATSLCLFKSSVPWRSG